MLWGWRDLDEFSSLELASPQLIVNSIFFLIGGGGGGEVEGAEGFPLIPTCLLSRKNIYSTIFHNNFNIYFVHTFPVELEFTTYYLSPDAFSYIVSTHFLYVEYENPWLITF